jgi:hypothetical protein
LHNDGKKDGKKARKSWQQSQIIPEDVFKKSEFYHFS